MNVKGQGLIGEVVIFGVSIMMALAMYFMLASIDYTNEQSVEFSVDNNIEPVVDETLATVILEDEVRASHRVETDYGEMTAYELISLYFSTDDAILIDGEEEEREQVRDDLEAYLDHKLQLEFNREVVDHLLEIEYGSETLEIDNRNHGHTDWNSVTRNIHTSGGKAELTLWIGRPTPES